MRYTESKCNRFSSSTLFSFASLKVTSCVLYLAWQCSSNMSRAMSTATPAMFKYLPLAPIGGRGGVQRFFMLVHNIPHEENLIPTDEWSGSEKTRLVETGENPCGSLPVTYIKNENGVDLQLSQHVATCRYLARVHKVDSGDAWKDYVQDAVADEYQGFRNVWVEKTFSGTEEDKEAYKIEELPKKLELFENLYKKYKTSKDSPYLSTSPAGKPLWGDSAIFGLVRDHMMTGYLTEKDLESFPNINAVFKAYGSISEVAAWIEKNKKSA